MAEEEESLTKRFKLNVHNDDSSDSCSSDLSSKMNHERNKTEKSIENAETTDETKENLVNVFQNDFNEQDDEEAGPSNSSNTTAASNDRQSQPDNSVVHSDSDDNSIEILAVASNSSSTSSDQSEDEIDYWNVNNSNDENQSADSLQFSPMSSDTEFEDRDGPLFFSSIFDSNPESNDETEMARIKQEWENLVRTILQKPKPKYTWTALRELYYRQNGLSGIKRKNMNGIRGFQDFTEQATSSLQLVERLKYLHRLQEHAGCVNCLNFNKTGNLLVSGSDDLKIIIWKWASKSIAHSWHSDHNSNVFQTKFVDFIGNGLDVVSSSRDGFIRHHMIPPCGSIAKTSSYPISRSATPIHKLALVPNNPHEILSVSEDGVIMQCDLRQRRADRLGLVRSKRRRIPLYSVSHHPFEPEFCVCGRDDYVRVYDKRKMKNTVKQFKTNSSTVSFQTYITCAVYNYLGSEILASSNDDIYLFDNTGPTAEKYLHKYSGHKNRNTIKGVNFYGPKSEYVMSGSDCGSCFIWDKNTEAIVYWMQADKSGAVNCLESHPNFPILATSGLDDDVKLWAPIEKSRKSFNRKEMEKCVTNNISHNVRRRSEAVDLLDSERLVYYVRRCLRNREQYMHLPLYSSDDDSSTEDTDRPASFRRDSLENASDSDPGDMSITFPCSPS